MKTKIINSVLLSAVLSVVFACGKNGSIRKECSESIEKCAQFCISNPEACAGDGYLDLELQKTIDSLRAVSNPSVRN